MDERLDFETQVVREAFKRGDHVLYSQFDVPKALYEARIEADEFERLFETSTTTEVTHDDFGQRRHTCEARATDGATITAAIQLIEVCGHPRILVLSIAVTTNDPGKDNEAARNVAVQSDDAARSEGAGIEDPPAIKLPVPVVSERVRKREGHWAIQRNSVRGLA